MNENILKSETKSYNTSIQQPINADAVNKLVNEQGISNTFFILGMIFLVSFFLTLSALIKKLVEVAKKIVEAVIESIYGLKEILSISIEEFDSLNINKLCVYNEEQYTHKEHMLKNKGEV